MIDWFEVESFDGAQKDAQGASVFARVALLKDERVKGGVFLPPHIRQNACKIEAGAKVFCVVDDASGIGAALYCDKDFDYEWNADFVFKKTVTIDGQTAIKDTLTVDKDTRINQNLDVSKSITATGDITTPTGAIKAGLVGLATHTHNYVNPSGTPTPTTPPNPG